MNTNDAVHKRYKAIALIVDRMMSQAIDEISKSTRSCCNCIHFNNGVEICKLANSRPPATVIAYACQAHVHDDEIPF